MFGLDKKIIDQIDPILAINSQRHGEITQRGEIMCY